MYLTCEFQEKRPMIQALRELASHGFGPGDLELFSDEPVELPPGVLDRKSHMSLAVLAGAAMVCMSAIAFVYYTQHDYPLITGGMPLFSFWATGVIFYELTMLGAILTTFIWFLWESGLLRRARGGPVPAVKLGTISLRVRCRPDQSKDASGYLARAGAGNIREIGELQ